MKKPEQLNALEESVMRSDSDLSGVLGTDKLNDGLSSERLRNFYRKLIQTDAQIRNLKKGVSDISSLTNSISIPDRSKRSLKLRGPKSLLRFNMKKETKDSPLYPPDNMAQLHKFNLFYPPYYAHNTTQSAARKLKRFANGTDEPTGFLIEKKQILVQYKPRDNLRKVPKCSHAPKESKSHEKQLKHPFYKNTQRLDELLDLFLDKNLPEIMVDPFGVDILFEQKDKIKEYPEKIKTHKTNLKIETETTPRTTKKFFTKTKIKPMLSFRQHKPKLDKEFFDLVTSKYKLNGKITSSTTPAYDVLLSVSTIVNSGVRKMEKSSTNYLGRTLSLMERVPHIRKLMQLEDEDDEGLGYDDLKEVLADESETHDETDKGQSKRKKRTEDSIEGNPPTPPNYSLKINAPGVHNPNWKGPMPLYSDELTSMIKQAAIQNVNRVQIPVNTKDMSSEIDDAERDLSDIEYIENYSDDKVDKLVRMAQAYSDYGVLEGKKELVRNENKPMESKGVDRIVKLSINKGKTLKDALLTRFKKRKCTVAEGIRFEFKPTTNAREDSPIEILKVLQKHVKWSYPSKDNPQYQATQMPISPEYAVLSAALEKDKCNHRGGEMSTKKSENDHSAGGGVIFSLAKSEGTTEKEEQDEVADNSLVFAKGKRTTKSKVDIAKSNVDDSIIEDMSVINIGKRSLKSIDYKDENDKSFKSALVLQINQDDNIVEKYKHTESNESLTGRKIHNTSNITNTYNNDSALFANNILTSLIAPNKNANSPDMDLGEFFRMMSNFFGLLASTNDTIINQSTTPWEGQESNIIKFTTKKISPTSPRTNESSEIAYPQYDSDMIENIGHRSRVLLAIEEAHDNASTEITSSVKENNEEPTKNTANEDVNINTTTIPIPSTLKHETTNTNSLTLHQPTSVTLNDNTNDKTKTIENKTVVKRNIPGDSNLIFWNDMYDEEYGIKLDPIDNAIRDKHSAKRMDFMKRSGNWIQDKMRDFANNFRKKVKIDDHNTRILRGAKYHRDHLRSKYAKRDIKYDDEESDGMPNSFPALTARMKEVCKEAAKAVQQTRNLKVRENAKEDTVATSLMQQLVSLMTNLIDFQVEQKTCVKLPPDLQEFLEWLTAPDPDQLELRNPKMDYHDDLSLERPSERIQDLITTPSSEKEEVHQDSRSDCLGTLHAVQDLMQQFDDMADEDKSKMTGIREYLENQLQFLNKQLTAYDDYKVSRTFGEQNPTLRFRRDLANLSNEQKINKKQIRRFKRKFLKNYGKKHTRTTASIYDGYSATEDNTLQNDREESNEDINIDYKRRKLDKRNLRDVYYKALADAKKFTTVKNIPKEELEGFDNAQIVRIKN